MSHGETSGNQQTSAHNMSLKQHSCIPPTIVKITVWCRTGLLQKGNGGNLTCNYPPRVAPRR